MGIRIAHVPHKTVYACFPARRGVREGVVAERPGGVWLENSPTSCPCPSRKRKRTSSAGCCRAYVTTTPVAGLVPASSMVRTVSPVPVVVSVNVAGYPSASM